jgi:hypothetical protein
MLIFAEYSFGRLKRSGSKGLETTLPFEAALASSTALDSQGAAIVHDVSRGDSRIRIGHSAFLRGRGWNR